MRSDNYHVLHTHAFVGMWAAFEAGVEDTIAAFIENDKNAAQAVLSRFRKNRFQIQDWPWSRGICLEIAQRLDQKAKDATTNGGADLFGRLQTVFGWLGINLDDDPVLSAGLAEASKVRNIIVHRYGEITEEDAKDVPSLSPWVGSVMPIDKEKFDQYYKSVSGCLMALMHAIARVWPPSQ